MSERLYGNCVQCGKTCFDQNLCDDCSKTPDYDYCPECSEEFRVGEIDPLRDCIDHAPLDELYDLCEFEKSPDTLRRAIKRLHDWHEKTLRDINKLYEFSKSVTVND